MKPRLSIDFVDFGKGFDKGDNVFVRSLSERFDVRLMDQPDILIYSDFGSHHPLYSCRKVYYTNESPAADFTRCDYALTSRLSADPRHFRLPYYAAMAADPAKLVRLPDEPERIPSEKTDFCAFVVSQDHGKKTWNRIDFFHRLSRYKKVSSGGRMLNNVGGPLGPLREDKLAFLRRHKFMIAFENGTVPGYITEKLYDAMEARCIPIYWGDPEVARDFNPKSFVNVADFPSVDHAIARIVEIDQDGALYRSMLAEPYFHGNKPNAAFSAGPLCDFFERIRTDGSHPVSARKPFLGFRWILAKRDKVG